VGTVLQCFIFFLHHWIRGVNAADEGMGLVEDADWELCILNDMVSDQVMFLLSHGCSRSRLGRLIGREHVRGNSQYWIFNDRLSGCAINIHVFETVRSAGIDEIFLGDVDNWS
jgi:hypothetical protein